MIRALLFLGAIGIVGLVIWWDRSEKSRRRQILICIFNHALAKKGEGKVAKTPVSILDVIDETDISPNQVHSICKNLENNQYLVVTQHTVKLTYQGVAYVKLKYLSEKSV